MSDKFFENETANGPSGVYQGRGAYGQIQIVGEFDGATVQVFVSQQGFPFHPLSNGTFTEPSIFRINIKQCQVFLAISGAGPSTNISAGIVE